MAKIGILQTNKPIDSAMAEIRYWLSMIGINRFDCDLNYDSKMNLAMLSLNFKGNHYEFRSTKQVSARLNMWAIARVMESKVRSQMMGIEDFAKSMKAYLALEDKSFTPEKQTNDKFYTVLGISSSATNEEIKSRYIVLAKSFHPDFAGSTEAKKEFEKRFTEINEAYSEIKKERNL